MLAENQGSIWRALLVVRLLTRQPFAVWVFYRGRPMIVLSTVGQLAIGICW